MKADPYGIPTEEAKRLVDWTAAAKRSTTARKEKSCLLCACSVVTPTGILRCDALAISTEDRAICKIYQPPATPAADIEAHTDPYAAAAALNQSAGGSLPKEYGWTSITVNPDCCGTCTHFGGHYCRLHHLATTASSSCRAHEPTTTTEDSMARTPRPTIDITAEPPNELVEQAAEAADQLAVLEQAITEDQVRLSEMVGMLKASEVQRKFVNVFTVKVLSEIKETKKYRGLKLADSSGKVGTVHTWEEFCRALGYERTIIEENIRNLSALGEDFLESSNRLGLGYRDLRKLRKLPDEDRTLVIQEVEVNAGDKEAIVSLIDDLAAKHAKEKTALEKRLADTDATLQAARRRGEEAAKERDELKEKLYKKEFEPTDWDSRVSSLNLDITTAVGTLLLQCDKLDQYREHIAVLQTSSAPEAAVRALAVHLLDRLDQVSGEFSAVLDRAYRQLEDIRALHRGGEPDYRLSELPPVGALVEGQPE